MSIRSTHTTRNLDSRKASVPTIGKGIPSNKDGKEGDITFRTTPEALKLYIKANGKWQGVKVGDSFNSLENQINNIQKAIGASRRLSSTYSVLGSLTLDSGNDIELNADGGKVSIYDDTAKHFVFDCDNTRFRIFDDANEADFFDISIGAEGATTITTIDADTAVAHLTLDADGDIYLDAVLSSASDKIGLKNAGTLFGDFQIHHSASWFYLYENGGASTDDYLSIKTEAHGATTITTNDSAAHAADLTLDVDGTINIDSEDGIIDFKWSGTTIANISSNRLRMYHNADQADFFNIAIGASGATTLATVDDGATVGHLILDPDGELQITPDGNMTLVAPVGSAFKSDNSILLKELPGAVSDVSGYGQIWVKTGSPNELYFTNEHGDDIQITDGNSLAASTPTTVQYYYESKICNFMASSGTSYYIPLPGYIIERTTLSNSTEYATMVAPYNGSIEKILFRSEIAQNGTIELDIYEAADATEVPGSVTGTKDTVVNIADDTTQDISFSSMTSGVNTMTKGKVYAIKVTVPSTSYDTLMTVVCKWDITS
tara:strand:+ start:4160 stop:5800 length:1641 start_codon:yes stop_codon:yes gene_type:complete